MNNEMIDFYIKLYIKSKKQVDNILNFDMNIDVLKSNNLSILNANNNILILSYYYNFNGLSKDYFKFKIKMYYDIINDDIILDYNNKIYFNDDNIIELSEDAKNYIKDDIFKQLKKFTYK